MPEPVVEIPARPAFKATEVCEIAQIPVYVLKSWEKEFAGLGVSAKPGGPRVYRRADVEQVLRIKQLLFVEGLTLAGARRRIEGEPQAEEEPLPELPETFVLRERVARARKDLRSLLDQLSAPSVVVGGAAASEPPWPPTRSGQPDCPAPVDGKPAPEGETAAPAKPRRGGRRFKSG